MTPVRWVLASSVSLSTPILEAPMPRLDQLSVRVGSHSSASPKEKGVAAELSAGLMR